MKNSIRYIAAIGVVLATGLGVPVHAAPQPRLVVPEPVFDFGPQSNDQSIDHTFVLHNEGDALLRIENIRSSCGCTVGHVSTHEIEPGGTAEITATYNLRGRQGRQRSNLTIETNDPRMPRTRLTMMGEAVRHMQVVPQRLFFDQVVMGQSATREVEIQGLPGQDFEITDTAFSSDVFSLEGIQELAPHHYRLAVKVRPASQAGTRQDVLRVSTSHERFPVVHVPVHVNVVGALTVAPTTITLMGKNPSPVTRYVVVRGGAVESFEITEVIPPSDSVRVNVLAIPQRGYRIQLSNLVADPSLASTPLIIRTDIDGMPEIQVPFQVLEPGT